MKKICTDKECPFVGYRFNFRGKLYCVIRISLFTTNQTGDDQWYVSFVEVGCEGAVGHIIRLKDFSSLASVHINRISSLHPDAPKVGNNYRHFKGNTYKVVDVLYNPIEKRWFVCYEALYEQPIADSFVRLLEDFSVDVGEKEFIPRFALAA